MNSQTFAFRKWNISSPTFFPKYFSFSINAAPQFLSMSWSLSKRTLELKSWWLFNWICLQTNDEDLISAKLLHENWNALGYTQVCSSTWTRIFNSFWQMLPIGLEPSELMISMILALQRSKNWETWKYFFIDFCKCQFYAQLKKPDWKYYWYLRTRFNLSFLLITQCPNRKNQWI